MNQWNDDDRLYRLLIKYQNTIIKINQFKKKGKGSRYSSYPTAYRISSISDLTISLELVKVVMVG